MDDPTAEATLSMTAASAVGVPAPEPSADAVERACPRRGRRRGAEASRDVEARARAKRRVLPSIGSERGHGRSAAGRALAGVGREQRAAAATASGDAGGYQLVQGLTGVERV